MLYIHYHSKFWDSKIFYFILFYLASIKLIKNESKDI